MKSQEKLWNFIERATSDWIMFLNWKALTSFGNYSLWAQSELALAHLMRWKGQTRLFQGLPLLGISIIPSNLIWVKNSTKLPLRLGYFWQIALKTSLSQWMTWNNENKWRWEGWKCWREKRQLYHSMTFIMRWGWHFSSVHGRMFRYLIVILSFSLETEKHHCLCRLCYLAVLTTSCHSFFRVIVTFLFPSHFHLPSQRSRVQSESTDRIL